MHHETSQPDFGTGKKNLSIYLSGFIICSILTLLAFAVVMAKSFSREASFGIIYVAAIIQFVVQLICFLRLNTQTEQGKNNVLSFIFTGVILVCIIIGSLWIMRNVNYNMLHLPFYKDC